jgi:hypothetical protein
MICVIGDLWLALHEELVLQDLRDFSGLTVDCCESKFPDYRTDVFPVFGAHGLPRFDAVVGPIDPVKGRLGTQKERRRMWIACQFTTRLRQLVPVFESVEPRDDVLSVRQREVR